MDSVVKMLGAGLRDSDWVDALEAFTQATKARDKALAAFERADVVMQEREAELRAVYERLTAPAPSVSGTEEGATDRG